VRTSSKSPSGTPYDYQPPKQDTPGDRNIWNFGSAHSNACNMLFCDGSVHDVSYDIDPELHRRLSHRSDGLAADLHSE
jgi:prepilin-type processing-associated H-X9-DG protein